jgi:hypothetical protein
VFGSIYSMSSVGRQVTSTLMGSHGLIDGFSTKSWVKVKVVLGLMTAAILKVVPLLS